MQLDAMVEQLHEVSSSSWGLILRCFQEPGNHRELVWLRMILKAGWLSKCSTEFAELDQ